MARAKMDAQTMATASGVVHALGAVGLLRTDVDEGQAPAPPPPAPVEPKIGEERSLVVWEIAKIFAPPVPTRYRLFESHGFWSSATASPKPAYEIRFPPTDPQWIPELERALTLSGPDIRFDALLTVTGIDTYPGGRLILACEPIDLNFARNLHPEWGS
jgi:hypothetical protein